LNRKAANIEFVNEKIGAAAVRMDGARLLLLVVA